MLSGAGLRLGKAQTVDADFEENRPADMAPLPTEEQIDQFCQGDTQALQQYIGAPTRGPRPSRPARILGGGSQKIILNFQFSIPILRIAPLRRFVRTHAQPRRG